MPDTVPIFPRFRKIRLSDVDWYKKHYEKIKPISDLSFNNLIVWLDIAGDLKISKINHSLILKYGDPFNRKIKSISAVTDRIDSLSIEKIFCYQESMNMQKRISMLSEESIYSIPIADIKKFKVTHDLNNSDYVVDVNSASDLESSSNMHFRRKVRSYMKSYACDTLIREYNLCDLENTNFLKEGLSKWPPNFSDIKAPVNKSSNEIAALNKLFESAKYMDHKCISIFIKNKLVGFVIYHFPPHQYYAIGNHIKCDYSYKNIFDFIYYCSLTRIKASGAKYYNIEQDLGIQGLRDHKRSMHPKFRINRFSIEPLT